jgi:hypothetical protein
MELGDLVPEPTMNQNPKVTVEWALQGLEGAIKNLQDGRAERRVRSQFHQLLLALEREHLSSAPEPASLRASLTSQYSLDLV